MTLRRILTLICLLFLLLSCSYLFAASNGKFLVKGPRDANYSLKKYYLAPDERILKYGGSVFGNSQSLDLAKLERFTSYIQFENARHVRGAEEYNFCFYLKLSGKRSTSFCVKEDTYVDTYETLLANITRFSSKIRRSEKLSHRRLLYFVKTYPLFYGSFSRSNQAFLKLLENTDFDTQFRSEKRTSQIYVKKGGTQSGGSGAFIFFASTQEDPSSDNFAVKMMYRQKETPITIKSLDFIHEGTIMYLMGGRHRNVLGLVDAGISVLSEKSIIPFIVMERGADDLLSWIINNHSTLTKREIYSVVFQMLAGVRYLHNQSLYHLDIKPENILVQLAKQASNSTSSVREGDPIIKIFDFDTARYKFLQPDNEFYSTDLCGTGIYRSIQEFTDLKTETDMEMLDSYAVGVSLVTGVLAHVAGFYDSLLDDTGRKQSAVSADYWFLVLEGIKNSVDPEILEKDLGFIAEIALEMLNEDKTKRLSVKKAYYRVLRHIQEMNQAYKTTQSTSDQ